MDDGKEDAGDSGVLKSPDWVAVSIGIMTIATIIAVSTVAAAISIVRDDSGESAAAVTVIAGIGASVSIMAYYGVVVMGLSALFLRAPQEGRRRVMSAAGLLTIQVGIGVVFAVVAILGPLLAAVEPAAPGGVLPPPPVC